MTFGTRSIAQFIARIIARPCNSRAIQPAPLIAGESPAAEASS